MWNTIASDARLVREALRGEPSAAEELVGRYLKAAHAVARAHLPGTAGTEDAVQEAFHQALRDLRRLEDPERFGPWLLAIVRNVSRKAARSSGRWERLDFDPPDPRPSEPLEWSDFRARLREEVGRLPPPLREAVLIYYYEGGSVRSVARAQGVSAVLARKRLQMGRDALRETLWRKLGEELRELLPSTREWRKKARQTTLLILAALPAGALEAAGMSPASAAASPACATASVPIVPGLLGGIIVLKKLIVIAVVIVAAISASFWAVRAARDPVPAEAPVPAASRADGGRDRIRELQALEEKSRRRAQELEAENRELRDSLARLAKPEPSPAAPDPASGPPPGAALDWSALSDLLVRNLDVLPGRDGKRSADRRDELRMREIYGELMKLSSRARSLSPHPFFEEEIFRELTAALLREPLGLNGEQVMEMERATREIFAALPENPQSLPPLERYRLRQRMVQDLWETVEGVLDPGQVEDWDRVRTFAEEVFQYGSRVHFGIDLGEAFAPNLRYRYGVDETQWEGGVRPLAEEYLSEARRLLSVHGNSREDIRKLAPEARRRLDAEFLELQARFEGRIEPFLKEEQRKAAMEKDPTIIFFEFDRNVSSSGGLSLF